jgi:hypothetical protein
VRAHYFKGSQPLDRPCSIELKVVGTSYSRASMHMACHMPHVFGEQSAACKHTHVFPNHMVVIVYTHSGRRQSNEVSFSLTCNKKKITTTFSQKGSYDDTFLKGEA